MKVKWVSLGCARTLVDSEVALGFLEKEGHTVVQDLGQAEVAIVNTCGFIESAKMESLETLLELCRLKGKGELRAVVALGCLAQRYGEELRQELKEVDGIVGTDSYGNLPQLLQALQRKKKVYDVRPRPRFILDEYSPRTLLTPRHFAYLKISEGCVNACSYCVIPKMKGPHRSRTIDSVMKELEMLVSRFPLSEAILIGQDTAAFGYDRDRAGLLPSLLAHLAQSGLVPWIRLLYAHPGHVTQELIDTFARYPAICRYVDLPIEHSHDGVLKRMNRGVTRGRMEAVMEAFREALPEIAIRTTVIVGFPGETEEEFQDLLGFLKRHRFDRLGAFIFSPEEGSPACRMSGQIPQEAKEERYRAVMELQREISRERNESLVGRTLKVLIDEKDPEEPNLYYGRTEADAPEVDGQVTLRAPSLPVGRFVDAKIEEGLEYDLIGVPS
ncbi:MAG: 30S ribosomal protein S12 methylthiotransferase RimO [Candidatus Omnitrophica bacterium]|nr:30S ribosomal protein S12 methylthiotransferase RimO [Candidatus Omnitrophota bacterium]